MAGELTKDHHEIYDRQLRVWGLEVQKKLTSSRVLIAGCTGLAAETAKNLILAGVGEMTLVDDTPVAGAAPGNFLVDHDADRAMSTAEASVATLSEMNPLVHVKVAKGDPAKQPPEFFRGFDVCVLFGRPFKDQVAVNAACRAAGVRFLAANCRSAYGIVFMDLLEHTCQDAKQSTDPEKPAPPPVKVEQSYPPLVEAIKAQTLLATPKERVPWRFINKHTRFLVRAVAAAEDSLSRALAAGEAEPVLAAQKQLGISEAELPRSVIDGYVATAAEMPAVSAVVGGVLAQEVLKVVSGKGVPNGNFWFFDVESAIGGGEQHGMPKDRQTAPAAAE